jgi:hypothetical protein
MRGKDMSESDRMDEGSIEKPRPAQRSDIIPESPVDVEARRRLEDVTSTLLVIMERLRYEEKELPAKLKYYPFPFVVDEDFIRKLDRRAMQWLHRAGILSGRTVSVLARFVLKTCQPHASLLSMNSWIKPVIAAILSV